MYKKHTIKRVLSFIKKYNFYILLSIVIAAASVALTLYAPILIGNAIDCIIYEKNVDFSSIIKIFEKLGIIIAITALLQWLMNICNNKITYNVVKDVRTAAFSKIHKLDIEYIDSHRPGDTLSRIITDIDQFSDGLLMGFTQLFTGILTIIGTLAFMFSISIKITVIVIVVTPLSLFAASIIAGKTYSMFKRQSETRGKMTSLVSELVGNQKVVSAFGYEKKAQKRFDEINNSLSVCSTKATFFSSLTNPTTRFVNSIVYACVAVFGAIAIIKGHISAAGAAITIGQLSCMLNYSTQYTKPFNEISGVITELQNAIACAERVFDFIDEREQISDEANKVLAKADGSVNINNVNFSYDKAKKLIENFNLSVKPGQRVAIVGPTGCGKSTIINLLMRFYDVDSGCIKISGEDIKGITRESLRNNYGMVLQETWLKSGTVRENICYSRPDATDEQMIAAAKLSHAHSFIKRLPNGYDTYISEDGGSLSQGQKQLLCITRVLLELPSMLILDEATSSIDTRTEIRIQKTFKKMMQGRTSFIVAHRLSTIKEADIIIVMNDGKIVEKGTHSELLNKNGFYAQIYNSQFTE